ncbi:MAG: Hydrogenase-4 component E [bacterium ADurb.Bin429]|nr:MAG: Hydrogenase-4 component E [bacterium ADurb.Bin429]
MQLSTIDFLAAGATLLAVWMCGTPGLPSLLRALALQTAILAVITMLLGLQWHASHYLWLAAVVLLVKAIAIPVYLAHAAGRLRIRRDDGARLGTTLALCGGCGVVIISYFLAPQIAVMPLGNAGAAGMALALLLIGMLLMMTRRLALSQIIGFLVLENGIFLYGLTQTHGMPLMIEMGVVFDVLVGVLVAGVVMFRLNRSFEHIDVTQLRGLRH